MNVPVSHNLASADAAPLPRYADLADPLNSAEHHTGKVCVEKGCERPAGTGWSPFWCQPCNAARLRRISTVLKTELARFDDKP